MPFKSAFTIAVLSAYGITVTPLAIEALDARLERHYQSKAMDMKHLMELASTVEVE